MKNKFNYNLLILTTAVMIFAVVFILSRTNNDISAVNFNLDEQTATIMSIKKIQPAVVSIIVYDQEDSLNVDLSTGQQIVQKQKVEKGTGTGFIISSGGYIMTNKHVVEVADSASAEYRVILNSGKEYYAQLIGKDPVYDLAILKIFDKNLPTVDIGDSDKLDVGTTVIAIGNTLGRYQNSATKGIVSGLGRSLTAGDQMGNSEVLDNVIQTDAQINPGNSGGPLINLDGKVVGINVAMDASGSSVGFAIPINDAKPVIKSVISQGTIVRPKLGLQYQMLTAQIAKDNNLPRNDGAWVTSETNDTPAVISGSAADKAGLKEGDIIFEIDGIKLSGTKSLLSVVQKYKPGQKLGMKVQRGNKVILLSVILDKF